MKVLSLFSGIGAFEKAQSVCNKRNLYKQAGNSIVVDVLEALFKSLQKAGVI